jgi:hypothetical protein
MHGLTVDVPAAWPVNAEACGTPQEDTVIVEAYVVPACAAGRHPHVDSVTVRPYHRFVDPGLRPTAGRAIDGHAARVVTSAGATTVLVPDLEAAVEIKTRSTDLAQRISDSVRVVTADAHGCESHRNDTAKLPTGRAPENLAARTALVPANPASVTTCGYDESGLRVGATLTGAGARQLAATLNAAPRGGSLNASRDCDDLLGAPSYVLTFTYDAAPDDTVWVRVDGCGVLGASNSSVVRQRTINVVDAVSKASGLLAIGFSGIATPIAE